jgi:hypothetical protein
MVSANFVTKHMIESSLSCLVDSYPLASADNSTSYLSLKKNTESCRLAGAPGGRAEQPAAPHRSSVAEGGRASRTRDGRNTRVDILSRRICGTSLPALSLPPLSRSAARPVVVGRSGVEAQRPLIDDRLLLPSTPIAAPAAAPLPARHRSAVAPLRGWIILDVKAPVPHGIGFAVDLAYNGAEAANNTWEHEPLPSSRETTAASSLGRGKGGLQTHVVRALRI